MYMHSCVCCKLCYIATNVSAVSMLAMEAIASVRAKAKAKANEEPVLKKRRLTPKAKAAADVWSDLAEYKNEGEVKVRRSMLEAGKQEQEHKMMYHKQRVRMADDGGEEAEEEEA